ncbi:MAG TPA: nucleotidyltransferase family protein [Polyangium sp.]|nr:nucleotidyltransferase family protein [Polyangium sp.]
MTDTVAIVLAAGKGMRLGGPKALLLWPGAKGTKPRPLAIVHAEMRLQAESTRAIVVARKHIVQILLPFVIPGLDLLVSDAPDELGPAGSLAIAASRVRPTDRMLVCPVDTLPAKRETTEKLLAALGVDGAAPIAARPKVGERFGHPVAMQSSALERYRQPLPPPLRDHLRSLGDACVGVELRDPDVLVDIDTPAEAARYLHGPPTYLNG